jgi:hypothetical protein
MLRGRHCPASVKEISPNSGVGTPLVYTDSMSPPIVDGALFRIALLTSADH